MSRVTIMVALVLMMSPSVWAEGYLISEQADRVIQAQQLLFNDQFDAVDSIYLKHIEEFPNDPTGYLFRAGALMARMSDAEENRYEQLFKSLLDTVEMQTANILDSCDQRTTAWMYLFRGHARSYRALYESKFGSFVKALKLGLSTIGEYEQGLRADSTLYDLYAGIGSYHYWKSAKAGMLRWVGIFKDEKKKGIAELQLAADSSLLHRDLARSALIWVWLDARQYDSAILTAVDYTERYPDGKTFLWPLVQAYLGREDYGSAIPVLIRLRRKLEIAPGNYYNLIQCDYYLARCYTWLEDTAKVSATARQLSTYADSIPMQTMKRQAGKLNYLRRLADR